MTHINYGSVRIPVSDEKMLGKFQRDVTAVLEGGGGWLSYEGTSDDGKPEVTSFLITPGVPISFQGSGTPESLDIQYNVLRAASEE